ncbi:fructosamine kinase family protein [Gracilibacillus sp. YIM 98692]|uniref:fructosamine kinase family protein n=1 Tax=Gracilibacillus sp. YIM 98692 TaxID=2663532 RepID=UPI001F095A95|nr:fructosamine kinase family protein [Gracilibacillus sp. YIM 98692]
MQAWMEQKLAAIGDDSTIKSVDSVSGGDINQAYLVQTAKQSYFVKTNQNVLSHFFKAEAEGLNRIQQTNTIDVPKVYHYDTDANNATVCLIMEWVEGRANANTGTLLGERLAELHLKDVGSKFGLDMPTFVGTLPQENQFYENWVSYYREKRLQQQLEIGIAKGRMPKHRRNRLEALMEKLDVHIPAHPKSSLLHGDLWGGNWLTGPNGNPYLIDPSIVYGDHAFEIAFTELFGGFPHDFYEAYQAHNPLPDYYQDAKPLYQLFYLLVHLNMFGEGYGGSVDRILKHYAG